MATKTTTIFEYHILAKPEGYKRFVAINGGGGLARKLIHAAHYVGTDEIALEHACRLSETNPTVKFWYRRCKTNMFQVRAVTIQAKRAHDTYGACGPVTIELPFINERAAYRTAAKILRNDGFEISNANPLFSDIGHTSPMHDNPSRHQ